MNECRRHLRSPPTPTQQQHFANLITLLILSPTHCWPNPNLFCNFNCHSKYALFLLFPPLPRRRTSLPVVLRVVCNHLRLLVMEFRESVLRCVIHSPFTSKPSSSPNKSHINRTTTWKFSFGSRNKSAAAAAAKRQEFIPPPEFICPLSNALMADPVVVSSGHTFERNLVHACIRLGFVPTLPDATSPDFSNVVPNLALKSTIHKFCDSSRVPPPASPDLAAAEMTIRKTFNLNANDEATSRVDDVIKSNENEEEEMVLIERVAENNPAANLLTHAATELTRKKSHFYTSSDESVTGGLPLPLATRPSCLHDSSSDSPDLRSPEEQEEENSIVGKLTSPHVHEVEEGVTSLRKTTRAREESRVSLCTTRVLSALKCLIPSRYSSVQVNAVAALVNLSLAKVNKVKILRSGLVPLLIDVLKAGFPEAQEHASGALFSLSLDDSNKTAIGVLGALQPLLHALRGGSELTRNDSALALYHLTLMQSNRAKLVKLGAVSSLVGMLKSGHLVGRVMLIVCNLAACPDGRAALLDAGGVECLVGMLRRDELDSAATRESCVVGLFGLSHGGLRFKGLAKEAGALEVLRKVEINGTPRAKEKAKKIMEMMRERHEEEEEVDWEELLELGPSSRTRNRLGVAPEGAANSSEF